jgi:Zn-dependent protease/CBS domain-containing protein
LSVAPPSTGPRAHTIVRVAEMTPDGRPKPAAGRTPPGRQPGVLIGRPFGIGVYISPYWFLIAGVIIIFYAQNVATTTAGPVRYLISGAFVLLLYLSVLVHELSHSLVAIRFHLPVRRILLYPLGGVSEIDKEPPTPGQEFLVAVAGPLLSLALAGVGWALTRVTPAGSVAGLLVLQLMRANLIVGIFNLLPGLPLDGGRLLRAAVWKVTGRPQTATIAAAWGGRVLACALLLIPVITVAVGGRQTDLFATAWIAVIAAFMWLGAGQAIQAARLRERLPGLQARSLARPAVPVTADVPLAEAVRRADEARAGALVVVDHDQNPIAIVNEAAVTATPLNRRPWIDVGSLARSLSPGLVLPADLSGAELLEAVRRAPASEYLLVEPTGQVFGVLATRDLDRVFAGV